MTLKQSEAFARIRLLRSPNIGPITYRQLLARFGSAEASLEALPDLGQRGGRQYRATPQGQIEREVEAVVGRARSISSTISLTIRRCWDSSKAHRRF